MMACEQPELDLCITQGKTFTMDFRWAAEPYVYKNITAIANSAPVRLTVPGHGMPDGWAFAVAGVVGPTELNAKYSPPATYDYHEAVVVDADTVEINEINGMTLKAYRSGGAIQYLTPVDLGGIDVRMQVRDRVGGTLLLELDSGVNGGFTVTPLTHTIALRIPPETTETLDWCTAVYDIEAFNENDVFLLAHGTVTVSKEVTTQG